MARLIATQGSFEAQGMGVLILARPEFFVSFADNADGVFEGVAYEDLVRYEDLRGSPASRTVEIFGSGIGFEGGALAQGTVNALRGTWTNYLGHVHEWSVDRIDISAELIGDFNAGDWYAAERFFYGDLLAGADTFILSDLNDEAFGGGGGDRMAGAGGDDWLYGGDGNDTLIGGAGRDLLFGERGRDVFVFDRVQDSAPGNSRWDVIFSFGRGDDRIDLSGIDADRSVTGNQAFSEMIDPGTAFTQAGQLKFEHGYLTGNTDADAAPEFRIRIFEVAPLDFSHLIL